MMGADPAGLAGAAIAVCSAAIPDFVKLRVKRNDTAAWALGLLVGINMIFGGSALVAMALHARKGSAAPITR